MAPVWRLEAATLVVPKSPSPEVAQVAWMNHFRSRSACSPSLSVHSLPEQTPVFSKLERSNLPGDRE